MLRKGYSERVFVLYNGNLLKYSYNTKLYFNVNLHLTTESIFICIHFFQLRVDGVLMRLRDTRMFCAFGSEDGAAPNLLRENLWREATFQSLSLVSKAKNWKLCSYLFNYYIFVPNIFVIYAA